MWADKPSSEEKHFAKNIHPCINSANYWFIRWAGPTRRKCGRCKARVSYLECGLEYQICLDRGVPSLALSRSVTCTRRFISWSLSFLIRKVEINTGSPVDKDTCQRAKHCS